MIPVSRPNLGPREEKALLDAFRSGWISGAGPAIARFEGLWADRCGRRHGMAVSSGTAALETAVFALDLDPGSEVILPDFTMIACLAAVVRHGLKPVFVDADPVTWCMDLDRLEARIGPATKAVMAAHLYGHPVDMDRLEALARRRGLKIIEDAAEAHGAVCRGRPCGSFGDISIFSFYGNKIVTTGEGGMVLCDGENLAERCRLYRDMGFSKDDRFAHRVLGQNFRMTNLQAALGCVQVERLEETLAMKETMARAYDERLGAIDGLQIPHRPDWGVNVHWMYGIVLPEGVMDAKALAAKLRERGVDSRPFFTGMHAQPVLKHLGIDADGSFPVSDLLSRRGLYLPSGPAISTGEIEQVCAALTELLNG